MAKGAEIVKSVCRSFIFKEAYLSPQIKPNFQLHIFGKPLEVYFPAVFTDCDSESSTESYARFSNCCALPVAMVTLGRRHGDLHFLEAKNGRFSSHF